MDWSALYPKHCHKGSIKKVEFADIGCGYGGLLGESTGRTIMPGCVVAWHLCIWKVMEKRVVWKWVSELAKLIFCEKHMTTSQSATQRLVEARLLIVFYLVFSITDNLTISYRGKKCTSDGTKNPAVFWWWECVFRGPHLEQQFCFLLHSITFIIFTSWTYFSIYLQLTACSLFGLLCHVLFKMFTCYYPVQTHVDYLSLACGVQC